MFGIAADDSLSRLDGGADQILFVVRSKRFKVLPAGTGGRKYRIRARCHQTGCDVRTLFPDQLVSWHLPGFIDSSIWFPLAAEDHNHLIYSHRFIYLWKNVYLIG